MAGDVSTTEERLRAIDRLELGERIGRLKDAMLSAPRGVSVDRIKIAAESWRQTVGEDLEIRRAKLFRSVVEGVPIAIHPDDLIVARETEHLLGTHVFLDETGDAVPGLWDDTDDIGGMLFRGAITREDKMLLRECSTYFDGQTAPDHVKTAWRAAVGTWAEDLTEAKASDPTPDSGYYPGITARGMWEKILSVGMRGLMAEAEEHIRRFHEARETDISRLFFWQAALIVCEAMITYARRYSELARSMAASESDESRRDELLEIAAVCDRVPEHPARTFHEAVQCANFIQVARGLEAMYPLLIGRLDQYLWPYFEADMREGRLTLQQAADLLGSALTLWGMKIVLPTGKTQQETHQFSFAINSVNLSGVDAAGRDATNDLSYLILHLIGALKLSSPTVLVNWHEHIPHALLLKALDTNLKTRGGIPLFENSDHVVASFIADGVSAEEAREWYGQGCVTPILPSRIDHNGAQGKGAVNVAAILDFALHRGVSQVTGKKVGIDVGDPRMFETFAELLDAFQREYRFIVERFLWLGTLAQSVEPQYLRFPFNSCIAGPGCMEKGQDILITDSNHSYGISDRALVDTADSLTAIKRLVFDDGLLTMDQLLQAIDANFQGENGERVQQMCLDAPKFGNDIDEADLMVRDVGRFSADIIRGYVNPFSVPCKISREGLSWHYFGGLGVGALANGRKAKEPLNDGSISPMRGMDRLGPTGVLRSVLKAGWPESYASCLNQKYSATVMKSQEAREKLAVLTDTFMRGGGQHIQFNLVDRDELADAKVHPDRHRDLVVRVGGFSAYFVMLSPEIQDDVICRSEQSC